MKANGVMQFIKLPLETAQQIVNFLDTNPAVAAWKAIMGAQVENDDPVPGAPPVEDVTLPAPKKGK